MPESDSYDAGRDARRRGKFRTANPHHPLAEPWHSEWFRGWDAEDAWVAQHGGYLGERLKAKLSKGAA